MDTNMIAILIINYKNYNDTIECIESLKQSSYKSYEIYVLDNASDNDSIEKLKNYEGIQLVISKINLGFAEGNNYLYNLVIKRKKYSHILLLNNDTVIERDMLKNLMKCSSKSIVCTPKIYYFDTPKMIWYAGGYISRIKALGMHIGMNEIDSKKYDIEKNVTFASGCCMLIPVNILQDIGLFDKNYFMYLEDADFCIKLIKNNYKIKFVPNAILWHKVSVASGGENSKFFLYYINRNRFYFANKNKMPKIYSYITRMILYLTGILLNNNKKIIYKAYLSYKNHDMGYQKLDY